MVESDGRDDGGTRHDDVGGVEPAAEPYLDDGDLDAFAREVEKCHGGRELEERELHVRSGEPATDFFHEVDHRIGGDQIVADADALAEVAEVRRREQAGAHTAVREHAVGERRGRSLAVRSRYVQGGKSLLAGNQASPKRRAPTRASGPSRD